MQEDVDDDGIGDFCDDYNCGDMNGDNIVNILDVIYYINYIYMNGPMPVFCR